MPSISGRAAVAHLYDSAPRTSALRAACAAASAIVFALALGAAAPSRAQSGMVSTVDGPKVVPAEFNGDLRLLPKAPLGPVSPKPYRPRLKGPSGAKSGGGTGASSPRSPPGLNPPMPGTIQNFAGMNFTDACTGGQCGGGWPPDTNGDVGPNHFIEAVNAAVRDLQQDRHAARFVHREPAVGGVGATPCNGNSDGDPIVVYDPLADRWILPISRLRHARHPVARSTSASRCRRPATPSPAAGSSTPLRMDPGGAGTSAGQHAQRLPEVRRLARLPVHGGQRIHRLPGAERTPA